MNNKKSSTIECDAPITALLRKALSRMSGMALLPSAVIHCPSMNERLGFMADSIGERSAAVPFPSRNGRCCCALFALANRSYPKYPSIRLGHRARRLATAPPIRRFETEPLRNT